MRLLVALLLSGCACNHEVVDLAEPDMSASVDMAWPADLAEFVDMARPDLAQPDMAQFIPPDPCGLQGQVCCGGITCFAGVCTCQLFNCRCK